MERDENFLDAEIREELRIPEESGQALELSVARKPWRIGEFDTPRDKEMAVFTASKKLAEYIFVMQNSSVELIEHLYRANYERGDQREVFQKQAMVSINLIDFYSETAKCKQAITIRQMGIIARQLYEIKKLLAGWMRSNKKY